MIRILHKRKSCIGCGNCADLSPETWVMNPVDGLADLTNSRPGKDFYVLHTETDNYEFQQQVAGLCPVKVIRVERIK